MKHKKLIYETTLEKFYSSIDKFYGKYVRVMRFSESTFYWNKDGFAKTLDTGIVTLVSKNELMKNGGLDTVFYESEKIIGKSAVFMWDIETTDGMIYFKHINRKIYRLFCDSPIHNYARKKARGLGLQMDGYYNSQIPCRNYTDYTGFNRKRVDLTLCEIYEDSGVVKVYRVANVEINDTDQFFEILKEAFEEYKEKELFEKVKSNIVEEDSTSTVTAIKYDGETDLHPSMLRAFGYKYKLYSFEIGFGKDHRYNRGHLKIGYFLREDVLKNKKIKAIEMKLPKSSFGEFIGKGGSNIKKIEQLVGKRIKLIELN